MLTLTTKLPNSEKRTREVKKMPLRCQKLPGDKAHEGIGVVDVGSPKPLLDRSKQGRILQGVFALNLSMKTMNTEYNRFVSH